jgi:hypothetical protein
MFCVQRPRRCSNLFAITSSIEKGPAYQRDCETSKDSGRRTSGISPGQFVTKLEQNLSVGHEVWQRDFVAYSLPERWASTAAMAWTARILLPTIRIPNDEFGHESAADAELTPERAVPSILCSTEGWLRVLMPE